MRPHIVLAHPFGNANVRQALLAFHGAGLLDHFVTSISADHVPGRRFFPEILRREISRREYAGIPKNKIESHPFLEVLRLLGQRFGNKVPALGDRFPTGDAVWSAIDSALSASVLRSRRKDLIIYAYEDGAYETFSASTSFKKVYELPIGYWKSMHTILEEERDYAPEWASTLSGLKDSRDKLERKDRELELADKIVVPSEFVASTVPERHKGKMSVIPYGCPTPLRADELKHSQSGPLKVFFCGSLGQRKGISYLFEAVRRLGSSVALTVVGSEVAPCNALTHSLQLTRWYKSLPRWRVLELMRESDVLVFPTLFEGRALVVLEALSQGLPAITTENSGTTDIVVDGKSGFVVPIRSVEAICAVLDNLHSNRDLLSHMKEEALKAASMSGWDHYRTSLIRTMSSF
jgi:starch synthase